MSDIAIRAENLSKRYRIGLKEEVPDTLFGTIKNWLQSPVSNFRQLRRLSHFNENENENGHNREDIIWALQDVSFTVQQSEVLGIIGHNGAGKSTLLKILSRITEPTSGQVTIAGRVASLLEVGTGFHPELSGRENIYLNGTVLGMGKHEVDRKFDEIVDFSGVEKFIDTPIKRYSSGMKVRLAFSVAAHLEPEILLIDEVLAVGDAEFQKKCLGKMENVAQGGRTVLFVSHNMVAMQSLCSRVVWLDQGRVLEDGPSEQMISKYLSTTFSAQTEQQWDDPADAPGNDVVRLHRVSAYPQGGLPTDTITMQTPVVIQIAYWNQVPGTKLHISLQLATEQDIIAFGTAGLTEPDSPALPAGLFQSECHIPGELLNSGQYRVHVFVVQNGNQVIYQYKDAIAFDVMDSLAGRGNWYGKHRGVIRPNLAWHTKCLEPDVISE